MKRGWIKIFLLILLLSAGITQSKAHRHMIWETYLVEKTIEDKMIHINQYVEASCVDNLSQAHYALASIYYTENNTDQRVLAHIDKAIVLYSLNHTYHMFRGDVYLYNDSLQMALNEYLESLRLCINNEGDRASLLLALGGTVMDMANSTDTLTYKNDLLEALNYLKQAISINKGIEMDKPYLITGNIYYYLNQFEESIASYKQAIAFNPGNQDAANNLSIAYRDAGRWFGEKDNNLEKAIKYLTMSYELNKLDEETIRLLGVSNGMKGNYKEALTWFEKSKELNPSNAYAWFNLSITHKNLGNKKKYKKYLKKAQELDPGIKEK